MVKALIGSRLKIRGRFDKPIRSARVWSETPDFSVPGATLLTEGREFAVPNTGHEWTIDRSGSLRLDFTDPAGLTFGRDTRIEIRAVEDSPPAIAWESPDDPAAVVTQAVVPVRGTVKDDLAVRHIRLRFQRAGKTSDEQAVTLFVADTSGSPATNGDSRAFDFAWNLAELPAITPGDEFLLAIEATDSREQVTSTEERRMSIITHEELLSRINSRLAIAIERLADALRAQRQVKDDTQRLRKDWQQPPSESTGFHELAALQHRQRQVEEAIGPRAGATAELQSLHLEMIVNRTDQEPLGLKVAELLGKLGKLNEEALPEIDLQLAEALQAMRLAAEPDSAPAGAKHDQPPVAALAAAAREQSTVVGVLQDIVGQLSEWDNLSRIAMELRRIGQAQSDLVHETTALRTQQLAAQGLPDRDERAMAKQLAGEQTGLATDIDKLQLRLATLAETRQQSGGLEALSAASRAAERLAIGAQMRAASEQLLRGEMGHALASEVAAAEAVEQLQNALSPADDSGQGKVDEDKPLANREGETLAAELRLLKAMQLELNERTKAAESLSGTSAATDPARRDEAAALARQQGRLAELTRDLLERLSKSTEKKANQP
jgi:hypothetical protein